MFFLFSEYWLSVSLYSLHSFLSKLFFLLSSWWYSYLFSNFNGIHSDLLSLVLALFSSFSLLWLPVSLPVCMYLSFYLSLIPSLSYRKPFPSQLISWILFQFPIILVFSLYFLILFMCFFFISWLHSPHPVFTFYLSYSAYKIKKGNIKRQTSTIQTGASTYAPIKTWSHGTREPMPSKAKRIPTY